MRFVLIIQPICNVAIQRQRTGLAVLLLCASMPGYGCWEAAAQRYQLEASLLYAIAATESGLNPRAENRNTNGSVDVGLMQINSTWLPTLARHGIHADDLWQPCIN